MAFRIDRLWRVWPTAIALAILVGGLMALAAVLTVLRAMGSGMREGWRPLGFLAAFLVLSLSESILLSHQGLPWVLFLAVLTRSLLPSSTVEAVPLARTTRRA